MPMRKHWPASSRGMCECMRSMRVWMLAWGFLATGLNPLIIMRSLNFAIVLNKVLQVNCLHWFAIGGVLSALHVPQMWCLCGLNWLLWCNQKFLSFIIDMFTLKMHASHWHHQSQTVVGGIHLLSVMKIQPRVCYYYFFLSPSSFCQHKLLAQESFSLCHVH